MKNITLSADDALLEKARRKAEKDRTTLNALFRLWLTQYLGQEQSVRNYRLLMERMDYARSGKRFNREELNER